VSHESVVVPLVFPVLNVKTWSDSFLVNRDGGSRRHLGQDLIAPKMTPIVACFDGIVFLGKPKKAGGHYTLTLKGDNGWIANYYHINNDTPGTDDGMGGDENAYAPGLESGQRVTAGQFIAYVGDSGNAENTVSHLHFELWDSVTKAVVNAAPSLRAATDSQPSVSVPAAEIKVLPKEVRYDGIVKEVDAQRKTVVVDVLTETKAGKARAVRTKKTITITIARKTDAFVLGNENIPVACSDLRPGLYAVLVAAPGSNEARIAAFAPREDE
jgi:murein DD-endopeptidase MepM/ murein hydrolase activator NlpD